MSEPTSDVESTEEPAAVPEFDEAEVSPVQPPADAEDGE